VRKSLAGSTQQTRKTLRKISVFNGGNSTVLGNHPQLRRLYINNFSSGYWRYIQPCDAILPAAEKLIFEGYYFAFQAPTDFSLVWDLWRLRCLKLFDTELGSFLKYVPLDSLRGLRCLTLRDSLPGLQYVEMGDLRGLQERAIKKSSTKNVREICEFGEACDT
jgi:hypothetical protein